MTARLAPASGEGARLNGGRFNLPDSFPVLYLCTTRPWVVAEMRRLGERQAIGVESLLPRVVRSNWRECSISPPSGSRGTLASHDNC